MTLKHYFIFILFSIFVQQSQAQLSNYVRETTFGKRLIGMSSRHYKLDDWEKPLWDSSLRNGFPSSLVKHPDQFKGKLIHLIGILDSVTVDMQNPDSTRITLLLTNKYWDYVEDYSIQDEKMFVSPLGDGKFRVRFSIPGKPAEGEINKINSPNTLFLVYGYFDSVADDIPVLTARQLKYVDYKWYSTKIFYYDIKRDNDGMAVTDKKGDPIVIDFKFLKVAGRGQNK